MVGDHRTAQDQARRVVVLLGPSGSGRSNFIDKLTRTTDPLMMRASHDLNANATAKRVEVVPLSIPDSSLLADIEVIDTPPLDTSETKQALWHLLAVVEWMRRSHENGANLAAVLFFHTIEQNRASEFQATLRLLTALTGYENEVAQKIWLVTTHWDLARGPATDVFETRHRQLVDGTSWESLRHHGAKATKFTNTYTSAVQVLEDVLRGPSVYAPLRVQKELGEEDKCAAQTTAVRAFTGLPALVARKKMLKKAITKRRKDGKNVDELTEELTGVLDSIQVAPKSFWTSVKLVFG